MINNLELFFSDPDSLKEKTNKKLVRKKKIASLVDERIESMNQELARESENKS